VALPSGGNSASPPAPSAETLPSTHVRHGLSLHALTDNDILCASWRGERRVARGSAWRQIAQGRRDLHLEVWRRGDSIYAGIMKEQNVTKTPHSPAGISPAVFIRHLYRQTATPWRSAAPALWRCETLRGSELLAILMRNDSRRRVLPRGHQRSTSWRRRRYCAKLFPLFPRQRSGASASLIDGVSHHQLAISSTVSGGFRLITYTYHRWRLPLFAPGEGYLDGTGDANGRIGSDGRRNGITRWYHGISMA